MLDLRRRRWRNIEPTLVQCVMFEEHIDNAWHDIDTSLTDQKKPLMNFMHCDARTLKKSGGWSD